MGISVVTTALARNLQTSHADLGSHVNAQTLQTLDPWLLRQFGGVGDTVMAMLNGEVTRQALMIAYLDDFRLMMFLTLAALPLVVLLRRPNGPAAPADPAAAGH